MVSKKRELNVERWQRALETSSRHINRADIIMHAIMHPEDVKRAIGSIYELGIADAWKHSGMQVYDFDKDFSDSILNEKWIDLLPDCLGNRPHDCFYMKLPCSCDNEGVVVNVTDTKNIIGFDIGLFPGAESGKGVYFGGDKRFSSDERVVVNTGSELLCLCPFAISKTMELMTNDAELYEYPTSLIANGVAYICSVNADIKPSYSPSPEIRRNSAKKRSQATWHDVGYRIGAELRSYAATRKAYVEGETCRSVRPHMRRAHWHHFWTGPRNGDRKLILKWVAPTMVGVGIESATVHRVG